MTTTARITGLDLGEDGVLLVRATCETCRQAVMHGAGTDLDAPVLGSRVAHCRCRHDTPGAVYTLTDPHDVIRKRVRVIRVREHADLLERRAHETYRQETRQAQEAESWARSGMTRGGGTRRAVETATARLEAVLTRGPQVPEVTR